jgi:plastocyanin
MNRRIVALLMVAATLAAACASSTDEPSEAAAPSSTSTTSTAVPTATAAPEAVVGVTRLDTENPAEAPDDSSFPPGLEPATGVGSYGFSRYVWSIGDGGDILPTLVEGPQGQQFRCQAPELPCSYSELKELHDSGDPIPDELGMADTELEELVSQLGILSAKLASYSNPDQVCADGYYRTSSQNPNMGIHMVNNSYLGDGFVVDAPEILLLAKEGGEVLTQSQIGECVDGAWTGDPDFGVVGAAYMQILSPDHPDGFAGPIDNWHVHYNTCAGAERENRSVGSRSACESEGGSFQEVMPVWMMHAYANPDFDSDEGVFAMFNGAIWPLVDSEQIASERTELAAEGTSHSPINNFTFGDVTVSVGEEVVFTNSDSVPHTVTSGTPATPTDAFDSGLLATGGSFGATFSAQGEYTLYCTVHPQMTGMVTVEG